MSYVIKLYNYLLDLVYSGLRPFVNMLGGTGTAFVIGMIFFVVSYKYNKNIFDWIERQTLGSKTYILEKFDMLFLKVEEKYVTYFLLAISIGLGLSVFLILGVLGKWVIGLCLGLIMAIWGFYLPRLIVDQMVKKRILSYQAQMVDALTLLGNGLSAGLSLPQSIGLVVDEMPNPISQEFNVILQQNRVGVPLNECFDNLAIRVPTQDNELFVTSINVLREAGGNLIEMFSTITEIIRERIRLQQKVDVFTNQGKTQGYTIAAMPFVMAVMFTASDPELMTPLFTTGLGIGALIVIILLDLLGLFIILKIANLKI